MRRRLLFSMPAIFVAARLYAQTPATPAQTPAAPPAVVAGIPVNYDEAKVGSYTLPDPLVLANGKPVRDAKTWFAERRPEIVRLFEEIQFGRAPGRPADLWFRTNEKSAPALGGKATRRQVTVFFTKDTAGPKVDLLLYLPANARGPVPLLLNVSFSPNASTIDDAGITPGQMWSRDGKRVPAPPMRPGGGLKPLPFLEQGIGVATVYYGDIDPDMIGGLPNGVRATYLAPGQTAPKPDEWGTIAAWSWGLSRVMDYLETDAGVDAKRVALLGISRIGKTVLWTGARDTRFALVIASCSGESGAALSRRNYGETVAHMTHPTRYAYQFAGIYGTFGEKVAALPMDGHMLVSLIAPRPVLLQTGDTDFWSDPKGEFLAAVAAEPVFKLLGVKGLETDKMPAAGEPILNTLGYYMHSGGHGTVPSDFPIFLQFMQKHFQPAQ
ncbi:MAG: acetylxylan esterase [Gemmatimonadota bacterium]